MRDSVVKKSEALEMVNAYIDGEKDLNIRKGAADCSNFPCPEELDSWSGQTNAFYVEDADGNEVYAVAYWHDDE